MAAVIDLGKAAFTQAQIAFMDEGFGTFGGVQFAGEALAGDGAEFGVDAVKERLFGVAVSGAGLDEKGG